MAPTDPAKEMNAQQKKDWNGAAGETWVDAQPLLDGMFEAMVPVLLEGVAPGDRVLDIGCGAGAATLEAARRAGGEAVGLDISAPLIAAAKARAEKENLPARFICDDAATYGFEPQRFDRIVSRFGVMFFDDPAAAFANIRKAAKPGARLRFLAWRGPKDNDFMTAGVRAAKPLLPELPPHDPDAPGQFAFADADKVRGILEDSGWSSVNIQPTDIFCTFPGSALETYMVRLGPVGRLWSDLDEARREAVLKAMRAAFAPFVKGEEVRYIAGCWLAEAKA